VTMMKGKLMKSLFRGKGVPRTPGPGGSMEGGGMEVEEEVGSRLRVHSEENHSNNSLDSPNSESPRSWPSTFTTPMSYIKDRKKRKASKFHIASPFEGEKGEDNVFGAEEHNLSQSIHSDSVSFMSFNDSPAGGEEEGDGAAAGKLKSDSYQVHYQQLKLQVEVQQKMISDYELSKVGYDQKVSDLSTELARKDQEAKVLRDELHGKKRLEILIQDLREKLQHLESENRNLQQRVNESSPLTDHQKELLLQNRMKSCSAPPSIMAGSLEGGGGGLADSGEELSNEWEVKSSGGSSVHSEVSVACLQDKLVQMEENNYSTHEELQATLQELTDLQHQLEELQSENRTLGDEKALLYESLCQQTEKLEACRSQLESTRQLLLQKEDSDRMGTSEREKKLMEVLKSAQDERDRLDMKSNDLNAIVDELRTSSDNNSREMSLCQERMAFLERTLHTIRKDKEHAERELNDLKNDLSCKNMELARLQTLNENFKTKLEELEAARDAVDKTEIEAKLDELRREKDGLETALSETSQQRDKAEFEAGKLKDASSTMKQELEYSIQEKIEKINQIETRVSKMNDEKSKILIELQDLQNSVTELEVKCQHHLTDKRELRASLSEIQKNNSDLQNVFQNKMCELESQLTTERTRRMSDAEEWKQFQADLLMTVRVANDFQTEAQTNLEQISTETVELKEKLKLVENENERLKVSAAKDRAVVNITRTPPHTLTATQTQVSEGLNNLRTKYSRSQSADSKATVKGLIDSIESAAKARTASYTRSSSTPTMVPTLSPIAENPTKPVFTACSPAQSIENNSNDPASPYTVDNMDTIDSAPSPVSILSNKASMQPRQTRMFDSFNATNGSDPLAALVKNGGSKRNALLKWCQSKTAGYVDVDITNFSSSWNDGMAFCAMLHTYMPEKIPYGSLKANEKRRNFTIAFDAAEVVGIQNCLNLTEMVSIERPDWQQIMTYVTNIYKHFET